MFEFHGWATVSYDTHDTDSSLQERCWENLLQHLQLLDSDLIQTQRHNGCDSLSISGQHNHRAEYVLDLFRWVASNAPGSYGLLYVRDDEDVHRLGDHSNVFRAWKLCRGSFSEMDDPFLSPCIPVVEDPYDPTCAD